MIGKMCSLKARFIIISIIFLSITFSSVRSEEKTKLIQVDWSFKGITGKFDRSPNFFSCFTAKFPEFIKPPPI